eukprot:5297949-Prymnesium_polylepis.3
MAPMVVTVAVAAAAAAHQRSLTSHATSPCRAGDMAERIDRCAAAVCTCFVWWKYSRRRTRISAEKFCRRMKRLSLSIVPRNSVTSGSMVEMTPQKVPISWPHMSAPPSISMHAINISETFPGVAAMSP